ncbi:MAG: Tetraacyldisaccharide 4-kinase [Pseudomonadota bacterium]
MQTLTRIVHAIWFAQSGWAPRLAQLLSPLSGLTAWSAGRARRAIARLPQAHPPVVIIGNLLAGGTGKTPLAIASVQSLNAAGLRVGLICSGYGARRSDPRMVGPGDDPEEHGDEAVLLAIETGVPVAAGRRRDHALACLLRTAPGLDLVIADDGLQHRHLRRTAELMVFDHRGLGNGRLLPAGPLREPLNPIEPLQAVALNAAPMPEGVRSRRRFNFHIEAVGVSRPDGTEPLTLDAFSARAQGQAVCAMAGIGDPRRFFDVLEGLGIHPTRRLALPDHSPITAAHLRSIAEPLILMTSKDAVKCVPFADQRCWVLRVAARPDPALITWLQDIARGTPTA